MSSIEQLSGNLLNNASTSSFAVPIVFDTTTELLREAPNASLALSQTLLTRESATKRLWARDC